ncbi:hypothetical protein BBH99_09980 [Chryseobacterium contaminans]|uniref:Uncharacterized protein n=1 Tax=Chryseobacterium contaminans TaxID=1423959 RepID=A0A1M6ZHW8_9FLAO|nr:hypothetical protein BBH99_09980 [Chryseobacterium contaminans]SHL30086.1 hypothetical protein SAMN05444407_103245 [Chryseobacterium contaminans]
MKHIRIFVTSKYEKSSLGRVVFNFRTYIFLFIGDSVTTYLNLDTLVAFSLWNFAILMMQRIWKANDKI